MITIIDYHAGNITSVKRALMHLGIDCRVSGDPKEILTAEKIIFPGVGNALSSMEYLNVSGIGIALKEAYIRNTPILGICLGTQIIFDHSEEGDVNCLGLISGHVQKFAQTDTKLKIPHMGWNDISIKKPHPVFKGLRPSDEFYFVHSYYVSPENKNVILAVCDYISDFPAAVAQGNIIAVQFHPEKSGAPGLSILKEFSNWKGELEC